MADRRREDAVDQSAPLHESSGALSQDTQPGSRQPPPTSPPTCPECAHARLTLLSDGDFVAVYKCPACGHLSAPVKR